MKYKISKTAILGPAYYLGSMLFILPYTFNKHNPGLQFKLSPIRAVLAIITWMSLNITFYILDGKYHSMFLITTTSVYFFPLVYSRQKILKCLNIAYKLLWQIENLPNITVPLVIIFSPLVIFCAIVPISIMMVNLFLTTSYITDILTFGIISMIYSLCFSVSTVFKDICQQLHCFNKHSASSLATLTKLQWQAYQLAQLISEAFGPFLMIHILSNLFWTLHAVLTIANHPKPLLILPIVYYNWILVILCFSSQNMNSQRTKLTNEIQKLMSCSTITKEDYKKLTVMMEQAKLGNLYISVLGFFQMDLPIILTISNVIVTYLMILLEIV